MLVRKQRILAALHYLVNHNHLYSDVIVNHAMLREWDDDFIPTELQDTVTLVGEADHGERKSYTVNLQDGNYENDFHAADNTNDLENKAPFFTGSITTDINAERQNLDIRILGTLLDSISSASRMPDNHLHQARAPSISYKLHGTTPLLSHYDNPHYFTTAFPTLFPTGIRGHIEER